MTKKNKSDSDKDRGRGGGIQSIERAFAILEAIARRPDGIGLGDLSREVDLHTSTAFNLAKTMVTLGYVRQDPVAKTYSIGRPIYALAASAINDVQLVNIAYPLLDELNRETGELCHLAARSGDDIVILAKTDGHSAFGVRDRVGTSRPAHCTAIGKVLLAAMPDTEVDRFLQTGPFQPYTKNTIVDPERIREEIVRVRSGNVAFDDEEFQYEVRCVAVPVRDFTGQTMAALGVSGPIWRISLPKLHEMTDRIRDVAKRLSRNLGYLGDVSSVAAQDSRSEDKKSGANGGRHPNPTKDHAA